MGAELDEELRDHVELKTQQYIAAVMTPQGARRAASLEMGGLEKRKDECRDARQVNHLENFFRDIRFGLLPHAMQISLRDRRSHNRHRTRCRREHRHFQRRERFPAALSSRSLA